MTSKSMRCWSASRCSGGVSRSSEMSFSVIRQLERTRATLAELSQRLESVAGRVNKS